MPHANLSVRIVILNYNGEELLPKCLPSIVDAARRARTPTRVTVLDNLSQDRGLEYVAQNFPEVEIVRAPENKILCSYNDYLKEMNEPVALLLNNDIRVDPGFIDPLMRRFENDPDTFLVAPRVMNFDGTAVDSAASRAGIKFGMFWCDGRYPGYEKDLMKPSETYSSGFGAFDRKKFLELGGYDELYLPGIMEDVDLCYRARQAGYHLYYEPESAVFHIGQASFKKKFGKKGISVIAYRNTFLFMWKNLTSLSFRISHSLFFPLRAVYSVLKGDFAFLEGFFAALRMKRR